jgi:glutathione S-transferase
MTLAALTLVSHNLCPYVQRAAIALAEKRVAFARVYVDLSDKPDWFRAISPLGKVPLLRVASGGGEQVIFESAVILEYLEETQANPLHPDHPLDRSLRVSFERLEAELSARRSGSFFQGDRFTLVDAVFGPIFRYFDTFEAQAGLRLLDGLPRIGAWRVSLAERPSVRGAVDDDYSELLAAFLRNRKAYISGLVA